MSAMGVQQALRDGRGAEASFPWQAEGSRRDARVLEEVLDGFLAQICGEATARSDTELGRKSGGRRAGYDGLGDAQPLEPKALRCGNARSGRFTGEPAVEHTCSDDTVAPDMEAMTAMRSTCSGFADAPVADAPGCLDEVLDAFLAAALREDMALPAAPWGQKIGISIYDEDAILGPMGDFSDLFSETDEEEDGEESGGSDMEWEADGAAIESWLFEDDRLPGENAYALDGGMPRRAKCVQPFCNIHSLTEDLPDRCLICLDDLSAGQQVWRLPCAHVFHDACAVRYFGTRRSGAACPTCRCDIGGVVALSLAMADVSA